MEENEEVMEEVDFSGGSGEVYSPSRQDIVDEKSDLKEEKEFSSKEGRKKNKGKKLKGRFDWDAKTKNPEKLKKYIKGLESLEETEIRPNVGTIDMPLLAKVVENLAISLQKTHDFKKYSALYDKTKAINPRSMSKPFHHKERIEALESYYMDTLKCLINQCAFFIHCDTSPIGRRTVAMYVNKKEGVVSDHLRIMGCVHFQHLRGVTGNTISLLNYAYSGSTDLSSEQIASLVKRRFVGLVPKLVLSDGASTNTKLRELNHLRSVTHTVNRLLFHARDVPIYVCQKPSEFVPFNHPITHDEVLERLSANDIDFVENKHKFLWDPRDLDFIDEEIAAKFRHQDDKIGLIPDLVEAFSAVEEESLSGQPTLFLALLSEILSTYSCEKTFMPVNSSDEVMKLKALGEVVSKLRMKVRARSKNDLNRLLATTLHFLENSRLGTKALSLQAFTAEAPEESQQKFMEAIDLSKSDYEVQEAIINQVPLWIAGEYKLNSANVIKVALEKIDDEERKKCQPPAVVFSEDKDRIQRFFYDYVRYLDIQGELEPLFQESRNYNREFLDGQYSDSLLLVLYVLTRYIGLIEIPSGFCEFSGLAALINKFCRTKESTEKMTTIVANLLDEGKKLLQAAAHRKSRKSVETEDEETD